MTKLLEAAIEEVRTLPENEQNQAAQALMAFARERHDYSFEDEQIAGIIHAIAQADRGQFAGDAAVRTSSAAPYEGASHRGRRI